MKISKTTILAVFFISTVVITPNTIATSCLNIQQEQTIQQLANSSNISYTALISIFDSICQQLDQKQTRTEAIIQYNLTKDYIDSKVENIDNVTETLNKLNNSIESYLSSYINNLENKLSTKYTLANLSQAVYNSTELINRLSSDTLKSVTSDVDNKISSLKSEIEDTIDEKISSQKKFYVSKEDFDKLNSTLTSKIENMKYEQAPITTTQDYTAYIFWGIIGLIAIGYAYFKFFKAPQQLTKALSTQPNSAEPIIQKKASEYKKEIHPKAEMSEERIKQLITEIKKQVDKTKETAKK